MAKEIGKRLAILKKTAHLPVQLKLGTSADSGQNRGFLKIMLHP
jgi:hypothetical protein